MIKKEKGRAGWHQTTPETAESDTNSICLAAHIKTVVVTLALWGLLPVPLTEWIIRKGGLRDA